MFKKLFAAFALGVGLSGAHAQDINFGMISTEATQNSLITPPSMNSVIASIMPMPS